MIYQQVSENLWRKASLEQAVYSDNPIVEASDAKELDAILSDKEGLPRGFSMWNPGWMGMNEISRRDKPLITSEANADDVLLYLKSNPDKQVNTSKPLSDQYYTIRKGAYSQFIYHELTGIVEIPYCYIKYDLKMWQEGMKLILARRKKENNPSLTEWLPSKKVREGISVPGKAMRCIYEEYWLSYPASLNIRDIIDRKHKYCENSLFWSIYYLHHCETILNSNDNKARYRKGLTALLQPQVLLGLRKSLINVITKNRYHTGLETITKTISAWLTKACKRHKLPLPKKWLKETISILIETEKKLKEEREKEDAARKSKELANPV